MNVSHEQIFDELARIHSRLDTSAAERADLLVSVAEVRIDTRHILSLHDTIGSQIKSVGRRVEEVAGRVASLELTGAERKGERGVWAAIISSKAAAWLVAAFVAAAAWASHNQGIDP